MMKITVTLLGLMLLSGASTCAPDTAQTTSGIQTQQETMGMNMNKIEVMPSLTLGGKDEAVFPADKCIIRVDFGSIGTGIDTEAERLLVDFIENTDAVIGAHKQGYGKEGEVAYCIDVSRDVNSVKVLKDMRAAVGEARKGGLTMRMTSDY